MQSDVVRVACGPSQQLVLFSQDGQVQLWSPAQSRQVNIEFDWHRTDSQAVVSDQQNLFWLSEQNSVLNGFRWADGELRQWQLPGAVQALYLSQGELFIEKARATDRDVVWLHPEL